MYKCSVRSRIFVGQAVTAQVEKCEANILLSDARILERMSTVGSDEQLTVKYYNLPFKTAM